MPEQPILLGPLEQSVVQEMANIGLGHATTALAGMTGKNFDMSVPEASAMALELLPERLGGGEQATVGIYMPIMGETGGHIAFLMPWTAAQCLWRMLIGTQPASSDEIDEIQASMMLEIGNIINGSFLSALSDMTGIDMQATPPEMCVDMCAAVLQTIVTQAAFAEHAALAVKTSIRDEGNEIEGFFVFIPTVTGLRAVFRSLGLAEAA